MNYKKMAVFNTVGNIVYLACLWLLTVVVTRMAGYKAAGTLTLAMSIVNVVVSFQVFGVRSYQVSDVSGEYTGAQYVAGRYLTVITGLIFCVGYCIIMGYAAETVAIILTYALYRSGESVSDVYWGELQKIGRLDIAAISYMAKGVALIVPAVLILAQSGKLYTSLAISALFVLSITAFYDRIQYRKLTGQKIACLSLHQVLIPLRACIPLLTTTMFPVMLAAIPRIFLERYSGAALLGYYGNVSAPTALISSVAPSVLVPIMTWYGERFQKNEMKKILRSFLLSLMACVVLGIMACVTVWAAGERVMSFVFTKAILPYIRYLYPLVWSTVLYAWTMCANSVLIAVRETKAVSIFSTMALLVAGLISDGLVKSAGIPGAILVLVVAYSLQFLFQVIWIVVWYQKYRKDMLYH